jgi:23S rRNA (guanosine2251-2'-O)-methyltransferase
VQRLLLQDDAASRQRLRVLADAAHREGTPITYAPPGVLTARAGTDRHQGAVAETKPFVYTALPDLLAGGRGGAPDEPLLLLALDGVEDPQNLGAILRSADGAGVHGVLLPEHRAAGITAAVARASAGAVDHVPVARVVNLPRALDQLKAAGVWVYGLDAVGAERYDRADYDRPVVVVAGAEGKGLSRLVSERCDLLLRIPLHGRVASLNVSVAASLALFAARSSRQG